MISNTYRLETEMRRVGYSPRLKRTRVVVRTRVGESEYLKKHSEGKGGETKDIIATTANRKAIGCFTKFGTAGYRSYLALQSSRKPVFQTR